MLLDWISNVNQDTIPGSTGTGKTRKNVFQAHIWKLYESLRDNGWDPVSSSYYDGSNYNIGTHWANSSSIEFPVSMSNWNEHETIDSQSDIYSPTEHSWVTLERETGDAVGDKYFITIDCRYPLPPHKSNTSVIIKRDYSENTLELKYPEIKSIVDNDNEKIFVGTSAVIKDLDVIMDKTPNSLDFTERDSLYFNKQKFDIFKGIPFSETQEGYVFDTDPGNINIKFQDYTSRCVAFVDIVFHKGDDSLISAHNGTDYVSATTSVRPKASAKDNKSWYVCWGFDYLENKVSQNVSTALNEQVYADNYKYAFHHRGSSGIDFIYQIYNKYDDTFRSGIGLLSVKNRSTNDLFSHASLCVNAKPKNYDNKSINYNSAGNTINLVADPSTYQHSLTQINNYYNTCFRNYNFSDGITSIRAGDLEEIGKTGHFPIYTPLKPSDCTIYSEKMSFASCSFDKLSEQQNWYAFPLEKPETHTGTNTGYITFKKIGGVDQISPNNTRYEKNAIKYKVGFMPHKTKTYQVYYYSDKGTNKKIAFKPDGLLYTVTLDEALKFSGTSITQPIPLVATLKSDSYLTRHSFHETVYVSGTLDKNGLFPESEFRSNFNLGNTPIDSEGYVEIYIGNQNVGYPAFTTISSSPIGKIFGLTATLKDSIIQAIDSINIDPTPVDPTGNQVNLNDVTDKARYQKAYLAHIQPDYLIVQAKGTTPGGSLGAVTTKPVALYPSSNALTAKRYLTLSCFIRVPIEDLYHYNYIKHDVQASIQDGNFNSGSNALMLESQNKGINYFSVFKSCTFLSDPSQTLEAPLAASVYTFSKNNKEISSKSIFGTTNPLESTSDEVYLCNKDDNGAYTELPIFLFSLETNSGKLKGYIPDVSLAPTSATETTLIKNSNGIGYQKIFWGGCWFPWNSNLAPDLGDGS